MNRDMRTLDLAEMRAVVAEQARDCLFVTVSGAHLYGFPSADSDVDLRGVHVLSAIDVAGLRHGPDTLTKTFDRDGAEMDLVTHDVAKFARMLLRRNGYVLEQLLSPLIVVGSPAHDELVALAPRCLTRHHAHHYLGFSTGQWALFERSGRLKPLLYTVRVLATGIHLMRTGLLEASLPALIDLAPPWTSDALVAKSLQEKGSAARAGLPAVDELKRDVEGLVAQLHAARDASRLPGEPTAEPALHDLVVRLRMAPR